MGEMFFINTVNGHLWHLIPGAHLKRPFTLDPNTKTYELLEMHADHWHFDTGTGWTKSRDGVAKSRVAAELAASLPTRFIKPERSGLFAMDFDA